MNYKDLKISNTFSEINYRIYDDNVIVLMGSRTDNKHRNKGYFKKLFDQLFLKYSKEYNIELCVCNKHLLPYFLRKGFKKTNLPVKYWNKVSNGINLIYEQSFN